MRQSLGGNPDAFKHGVARSHSKHSSRLITMTQAAPCRWLSPAWLPFAAAVLLLGCRPQPRTPQDASSTMAGPAAPHEHAASLGYLTSR
jgi:hypothetical protein